MAKHYTEFLNAYLFLIVLGLLCCTGFSLAAVRGATLCCGVRASLCGGVSCGRAQTLGLQLRGLQQLQLLGSRAQAQRLWCTGLAALQHVGSS